MTTAKKASAKKTTANKSAQQKGGTGTRVPAGAKAKGGAVGTGTTKRVESTKAPAKRTAAAKEPAAARTLAAKKAPAKKAAVKGTQAGKESVSLARGKDPKGGLTAEGRRYFKEKEGLNLRPGVKGKADTPEKMVRKGSFLRRHFANPPGPVKDAKGEPTRQALQAAAWGEPVPQNEADEKKLAAKGSELLEQYHAIRDDKKATARKKTDGKTAPNKKG